ncbi:FkbM family methyltransferase [Methylobacterium nigriterrae]|uniref:FkbM family methyltransferase n=1 Tax=Methylobacterium nigriterrae TaxID=3127512 RepID=UPI003013EC7C
MISYAQNFEDVLLRRALPDIERGFYIDIGAFHPIVDNVTHWFYSQGWSGINVEPNPRFHALLRQHRPHDLNLAAAVSGQSGILQLHLLDGLSTTVGDVAEQHAQAGRSTAGTVSVEALSLNDLFERHTDGRTVDFLKIDVEGAEGPILEAYPFTAVRPRILVIEATEPDSVALASNTWEAGLLSKGYQFCYFDGLNRYFVRDEDAWRRNLFDVPPNVFDQFRLPFTDRRVDYVACAKSVFDQIPDGGINGLIAERDRLRDERDAWAAQAAQRLTEREALAAELRAERAAFALELSQLMQEQSEALGKIMQEQSEALGKIMNERDSALAHMKELAESHLARRELLEGQLKDLEAENRRLNTARDASLIQNARLQIKLDAMQIQMSNARPIQH